MSHTMTETDLSSPTSTTSSTGELSPHKGDDRATYKKSNKPMMEKKRRARINSCLSQLKSLVLQAMKKDNSQYSKLEKADILELTVRHLRNVQRCQNNAMAPLPDAMTKYRAGFNECANEVVRYLGESQGVNDEARTRIISHLTAILTPINSLPLTQTHTPILPAPQVKQEIYQPHLHQLNLQQQHSQSLFFTSSSQPLSIDNSNAKSIISYPTFLQSTGSALNTNHVMSSSPTAFQCPATTGVTAPNCIQIPCLATASMATTTTTQLHLVPNTLTSGHVALVLAPHSISRMNLYASQQGCRPQVGGDAINSRPQVCIEAVNSRPQVCIEAMNSRPQVGIEALNSRPQVGIEALNSRLQVCIETMNRRPQVCIESTNTQPQCGAQAENCKYQVAVMNGPADLTNPQPSHRQGNTGVYQRSSPPFLSRPNLDHPHKIFLTSSSDQTVKQSNILKTCSVSNSTATSAFVSGSGHFTTTTTDSGMSVVRTTSTWRPW